MFYSQRMWLGAAFLATVVATIAGMALIEHSQLLALSPIAPFALAFAALFFIAASKGEQWALGGFFVIAIFAFSVNLRGDTPTAREDAIDAVVLIRLAIFALACFVGLGSIRAFQKRMFDMPTAIILAYLALAIIQSGISDKPIFALATSFGLLAWILFAIALNDRFELEKLMLLVISTGAVFCLGSLVAFYLFPDFGAFVSFGVARLTGLASRPNNAANIAAITMVSVVALYLSGYRGKAVGNLIRWWLYISFASSFAVLWLTGTRTALAAALVAVLAIIFQQHRLAGPLLLIGTVVGILAAIAFLASPAPFLFINELAAGAARSGSASEIWSFAGRLRVWNIAVEQIGENPFVGFGYGLGAQFILENYTSPFGEPTGSAHNTFLQTSLDIGVFGAVLLAVVFVWSFREYLRNPSPFRDGIFIIVFFMSFMETGISKPGTSLALLWLVSLFSQTKRLGTGSADSISDSDGTRISR